MSFSRVIESKIKCDHCVTGTVLYQIHMNYRAKAEEISYQCRDCGAQWKEETKF